MFTTKTTNVLLPRKLLDKRPEISEQHFLTLVRNYLTSYPDYHLVKVENGFAVCTFLVETNEKKRRRKA